MFLSEEDAISMIKRYDYYDSKRNEIGKGRGGFKYQLSRQQYFVSDQYTGLMWEYSESPKKDFKDYKTADHYIRNMNSSRFGGYKDWRLPTLEEAMSIVECVKNEFEYHIDSQFNYLKLWVWTADKYNAEEAWIVDYKFGSCFHDNIASNKVFVRAVRTNFEEISLGRKLRSKPYDNSIAEIKERVATMPKVFISHSSDDKQVATALVELLKSSFFLENHEIRCSSVPSHMTTIGEHISTTLRKEITTAEVIMGIVTPHSVRSAYVLFELGASWGLDKPTFPLLARGADSGILPGPLIERHAIKLNSSMDVQQVLDDLESRTSIKRRKGVGAEVQDKINKLVAASEQKAS